MRIKQVMFAVIFIAAAIVLAVVVLRLLFPLPDISQREHQEAFAADPETQLGQLLETGVAAHPGKTGVFPLADGKDALASRLELIERAQNSIDAQYYIWHDDTSGILLLDALRNAAARGVRVRLLLFIRVSSSIISR